MSDTRPIGIFDSGVGGLTVVRSVMQRLPGERIVYLGDTARVPYGNKTPATVRRYACNISAELLGRGCKAIVIACNTASAFAVEAVRAQTRVPVVAVIEPVATLVAASSRDGRVGVLGTRGTVRSGAYPRALAAKRAGLYVVQRACPLFVPLAEEGWTVGDVPEAAAERYLGDLAATERLDSLILGCTHYPLLSSVIERAIRRHAPLPVEIHASGAATAERLAEVLREQGIENAATGGGGLEFLVTDDPEGFVEVGARFLGVALAGATHVDVRDRE